MSRAQAAMVVTAVVAGGLNLAALQQREQRVAVLIAARDVPAGAVLDEALVAHALVDPDSSLARSLIPAARLPQRHGWLFDRALSGGEPLRWSDLRNPDAADGTRAMSVPIEAAHAVAGALRSGDIVDIIAVRDGVARWVLTGVTVIRVNDEHAGGALGAARPYSVTVAVTPADALPLAWALRDAEVEIVRATGAPPISERSWWTAPGSQEAS